MRGLFLCASLSAKRRQVLRPRDPAVDADVVDEARLGGQCDSLAATSPQPPSSRLATVARANPQLRPCRLPASHRHLCEPLPFAPLPSRPATVSCPNPGDGGKDGTRAIGSALPGRTPGAPTPPTHVVMTSSSS